MFLRQPLISVILCLAVVALVELQWIPREMLSIGLRAVTIVTVVVAARFGRVTTVWLCLSLALAFEFHLHRGSDLLAPGLLVRWLTVFCLVIAVAVGASRSRWVAIVLLVSSAAMVVLVNWSDSSVAAMRIRVLEVLELAPDLTLVGVLGLLVGFVGWRYSRFRRVSDGGLLVTGLMVGLAVSSIERAELWLSVAVLSIATTTLESVFALAYRDGLTGLRSRRSFDEALRNLSASATIAMVDIDHFKRVNDRHGHDVGDQVLRKVASELESFQRAFRYGGEEFAVVFSNRDVATIRKELEEFRSRVAQRKFVVRPSRSKTRRKQKGTAKRLNVTVSIGAAVRGPKRRRAEDVVKAADRALYRAKRGGRNRVIVVAR